MFKRIQREWNVPVVVMNDGDVTALAGALSLGSKGMLGIAMGSSQAAGFMDPHGRIPGWLNELAFVPVDYQPQAAVDEWSGDRGTGVMYFSQQAVNKLLPAAKITLPEKMDLPERLKEVQDLMAQRRRAGDENLPDHRRLSRLRPGAIRGVLRLPAGADFGPRHHRPGRRHRDRHGAQGFEAAFSGRRRRKLSCVCRTKNPGALARPWPRPACRRCGKIDFMKAAQFHGGNLCAGRQAGRRRR